MSLIGEYDKAIARAEIHDDPLQRKVLQSLQRILNEQRWRSVIFWRRRRPKTLIKGLYLHGPVGGGKTFLMDLFFQQAKTPKKSRVHFHEWMSQIDAQLRRLQGHTDPLTVIARQCAQTTRLLCIDEFFVDDIATAMILAGLVPLLLQAGIVLVITSNTPPDQLYWEGLQRLRFIPVITLLKQYCEVLDLMQLHDYRLGRTPLETAYLHPLNAQTTAKMTEQFAAMAGHLQAATVVNVQNRDISVVGYSDGAVWFQFDKICRVPRSQLDYLEIARRFHTVFVSDVPQLSADDTVGALLLTHLIDVMYDHRVRLVISAEVPIDELYLAGEMSMSFQRTRSRLQEMQSVDYLQ
jgi:cell division protein ZapE